jgi:hypothetical protein
MRVLKIMLPTVVVAGLLALALPGADSNADDRQAQSIKDRFTGHYELVSFVQFPAEGGEVDANYKGRIMYDGHGNMSAQGMPRDLPERAAQTDELVRGGFAYWGWVEFDLENNIVIHHVTGSPTRGSWVGEPNVRHFEFTDEHLKLSMKDASGRTTGTLTWLKISDPVMPGQ